MRVVAVKNLLQRLVDAMPAAWRRDRVFRVAVIGAGITSALFVLRLVGTPALDLQQGTSALIPAVPYLSAPGDVAGAMQPLPDAVPKIAPGHPLGDATVTPAPDSDRFGTLTPERHP